MPYALRWADGGKRTTNIFATFHATEELFLIIDLGESNVTASNGLYLSAKKSDMVYGSHPTLNHRAKIWVSKLPPKGSPSVNDEYERSAAELAISPDSCFHNAAARLRFLFIPSNV